MISPDSLNSWTVCRPHSSKLRRIAVTLFYHGHGPVASRPLRRVKAATISRLTEERVGRGRRAALPAPSANSAPNSRQEIATDAKVRDVNGASAGQQ